MAADPSSDPNARLDALVAVGPRSLKPRRSRYDLLAIGGGTAGLVGSTGMALLGASVGLVEKARTGGDCLIGGCVPSKALIHAGRLAHEARTASRVGVHARDVQVDFPQVMQWLRSVRAQIAEDDAIDALQARGIEVIGGEARFVGPREVEIDGSRVGFKRCLLATGSAPRLPDIEGLAEVDALTSDTLFELTALPTRLAIVGAGPIGCEIAQAMTRLGAEVTLVQRSDRVLPRDDPRASELIAHVLREEGVLLHLRTQCVQARRDGSQYVLTLSGQGSPSEIACDRVLVATGRRPNLSDLNLQHAGIEYGEDGVHVNKRHRTTNRRVYAAGDVVGGFAFTHAAWAHAEYAVLNAFFPAFLDVRGRTMPWTTYTDPEVAHVGPPHAELQQRADDLDVVELPLRHNDRARTEGEHRGFARVHLRKGSDRIVAATIVARHAGELIGAFTSAITHKQGLAKLTLPIVPYPTRSMLPRAIAYEYRTRKVSPRMRAWARWWFRLLR